MNRERREEGFFRFIKRLSAPFLELLFPSRCPACGAYVEDRGDWFRPAFRMRFVCADCLSAKSIGKTLRKRGRSAFTAERCGNC